MDILWDSNLGSIDQWVVGDESDKDSKDALISFAQRHMV